MAFRKTGSFKVAKSERIDSPADWAALVAAKGGKPIPQQDGPRMATKASESGEVVAQIADPDNWIFVHTTIMASVDIEDGSEFLIEKESEKWINDNGDAWGREQLLKDFGTFRSAAVYVEHNQHPEHAKGKVFDVAARDMGDTVLVDILFGVEKRHDNLVKNITAGILNAVSMGCSTAFTKCSVCGNVAHTENDYCAHIKDQKRQAVKANGRTRKVAELCFDNNFFDCSIVASPAFSGAVFRRLVASSDVLRSVMSAILCSEIEEDPAKFANEIRKAASMITEMENVQKAEVSSESLVIEAGIRLFSTKRGTGEVKSVGKDFVNVAWQDGIEDSIALGLIDASGDERILATKRAAKPDVPDTGRAGYHPINNTETEKHGYQIGDRDFSDIPPTNNIGRTKSIDAHNRANPTTKLEGTDQEEFDGVTIRSAALHRHHRCPACKTVAVEFVRRATSAEAGNGQDTLLCGSCGAVDMNTDFRRREALELAADSADIILACRTAAIIENPDARAAFIRSTAKAKSAGASAEHVEAVMREAVESLGLRPGKADAAPAASSAKVEELAKLAGSGGRVTTHDVASACGDGADAAAAGLVARGVDVVPANLPVRDFASLEKRLEATLGEGRWSKVRLLAISGDAVLGPLAKDRVFLAWDAAMENPYRPENGPESRPIDFCDACMSGLGEDGVCTGCGKDATGDCHACGEEGVPLYEGKCGACFHTDVDQRAQDFEDMKLFQPSARTASFEKWPNILDGVDVPDATDERRSAAAELARLVDSRRVNVRIEASRKVSRILQAHPGLSVREAKAVLWKDLCEFMPAHEAGHVVSKVVDVKTQDQFGLGRNRPLEDAREPVEEPGVRRQLRASGSGPR